MILRGLCILAAGLCLAVAGGCGTAPSSAPAAAPVPALLRGPPPPATCVIVHRRAAVNYAGDADILAKVNGQLAYWDGYVSMTTREDADRETLYARADAELEEIIHDWAESDRRTMIAALLGDCLDQRTDQ